MSVQENIKKFLLTEIAADLGKESLSSDEDLLEQGIIDSMGIMSLIEFMEANFNISIEDQEIIPENFQTIRNMEKFVEQKKKNAQ